LGGGPGARASVFSESLTGHLHKAQVSGLRSRLLLRLTVSARRPCVRAQGPP
jgi:hypothetical protein